MASSHKHWTQEDNEYLRAHLNDSLDSLSKRFGVTYRSIYMRIHRLGMRRTTYQIGKQSRFYKAKTACETCKRADASMPCPWVDHFEPVPGWIAKATEILNPYNGKPHYTPSYKVISCPLHIPDEPREREPERKEEEG